MGRLALTLALLLPLSGCMTTVQLLTGEAPAFMGGTRAWAQDYGAQARGQGPSPGRYAFLVCDLPLSLLVDLALSPITVPCEVAHGWQIDLLLHDLRPGRF